MYRVGIVGCGVIGSRLAESFTRHERTTVRAVCDREESKAEAMAAEYDAEAFGDAGALVDLDSVDVVYVGVPPKHHAPVVKLALDAGKHVVCEKPIAENAAVGRQLAAAARESGLTTAINFPFRYTPGFVELRERVARGEVGEPKRISLDFRFPRWPRAWQDVDWLAGREQGGPLREVGSHFLFGVQEVFGGIENVRADVTYTAPERYEESIVGYFTADGVRGTVDLVCDCAGSEENAITVLGTEGSLSLTGWRRLVENPGEEDERVIPEDDSSTTMRLIDEFVAELDGDDGDLVSFEEATRVQAVVDEILGTVPR